jgi:tetratricopeptide (TPR) repeat protein
VRHHPRITIANGTRVRHAGLAAVIVTLLIGASACGGSSSGGSSADPGVTLKAAVKLQDVGNVTAAKQLYLQVIKTQPSNYFAQYDLGVIAQNTGDSPGALSYYGAALTANPKYVPALYNEATIYAITDPVLAISIYRQVISLQPNAPTASLNLGLLEIKHNAPKRGVKDLAQAVADDSALLAQVPKHLRQLVQAVGASAPSTTATPTTSPS